MAELFAGSARPGSTVVSETAFGQAATAGTAGTFSRSDHTHGTPPAPGGGGTLTEGTSATIYDGQVVVVDHPAVPLSGAGSGAIQFAVLATLAGSAGVTVDISTATAAWTADAISQLAGGTFGLLDLGGGTYTAGTWGTIRSAAGIYSVTRRLGTLTSLIVSYWSGAGLTAKAAVSLDGGTTWQYHTGAAWATMNVATEWDTKGCELQSGGAPAGWLSADSTSITAGEWAALGCSSSSDLRVCFAFKTTNVNATPTLQLPSSTQDTAAVVMPILPPTGMATAGMSATRDPVLTTRAYFTWQAGFGGGTYTNFRCQVRT